MITNPTNIFSRKMQAGRQWNKILKGLKECIHLKPCTQRKHLSKLGRQRAKTFLSNKQMHRDFSAYRPVPQEMEVLSVAALPQMEIWIHAKEWVTETVNTGVRQKIFSSHFEVSFTYTCFMQNNYVLCSLLNIWETVRQQQQEEPGLNKNIVATFLYRC